MCIKYMMGTITLHTAMTFQGLVSVIMKTVNANPKFEKYNGYLCISETKNCFKYIQSK